MVVAWIKYSSSGPYYPTNFLASFEYEFLPGAFIESIIDEFQVLACTVVSWTPVSDEQRDNFIASVERERLRQAMEDNPEKKVPHLRLVKGKTDDE
jgi:hypothetical protein